MSVVNGNLNNQQATSHNGKKRLRKIVKPPQSQWKIIWIAGHAATIAFGIIYAIYYVQFKHHSKWIPILSYHLSLIGVWVAYYIAINTQYNLKSLPHYTALLATDNVQFLILSIIWMFNRTSLFKILPYMIIASLQLSQEFNISFLLKFGDTLSLYILYNELFLFLLLFIDTILMRGTSGFGLALYSMFYWLRILQSENARFFLYTNAVKFDGLIGKIKNEKVVRAWATIKKFLTTKQATFEHRYLE